MFAVDPVNFGQLWSLIVGTAGFEGAVLFVPETGFLYYCNRSSGLHEINVTTHLNTRTLVGGAPEFSCFRPVDVSLFTCSQFGGVNLRKVDLASMTLLGSSATLAGMEYPLWCPLTDKIYLFGRAGSGPTEGLACVNPDTFAVDAVIPDSKTFHKKPAYSPVSEQIYLVREVFPVFQLLVIDPIFNTVVQTINIAPYFPLTTANQTWKCYALGCNVYVFSGQTAEYLVIKADDNSVVASGTYSQIPLFMASGANTTEGIAMVCNVYPSPFCRLTPP